MNITEKTVLSDVVSAIVSSVTKARHSADFEAMRVAQEYQRIELLRGLPVPRLRLSNIKISIPVIVTNICPEKYPVCKYFNETVQKVKEALIDKLSEIEEWLHNRQNLLNLEKDPGNKELEIIKEYLDLITFAKKIKAITQFGTDFTKRLTSDYEKLQVLQGSKIQEPALVDLAGTCATESLNRIMETIVYLHLKSQYEKEKKEKEKEEVFDSEKARNSVPTIIGHKIIQSLLNTAQIAAEMHIIDKHGQPADLEVAVDTESIKNSGGGPDAVTRLSFVMREEGLEWITDISQDMVRNKLVSE